jgi:hypothetical protein
VEDQEGPPILGELDVRHLPSLGAEDAAIETADGVEPVAGQVLHADDLQAVLLRSLVLDAHGARVAR